MRRRVSQTNRCTLFQRTPSSIPGAWAPAHLVGVAVRSNTIKPVISVLFSLMAIGQPSAALNLHGLRFTYTETQNFQEIADLIRTMTDVPWASVDNAKTLWLYGGKSDQITLAEWLFHELDKPATRELPGS